ncbi:MAG TPA: FecR domain-containing protein [Terriglobia bacterium]|jgi:predicted anti-sigma-YlaC factor YlaD
MFRKHIIRDLSAYHHNELTLAARQLVETHLQNCPKCRTAYGEIQLGARLASVLHVSAAPEPLWDVLQDAQRVSVRHRRWIPAIAAAGFAIVVLALVISLRNHAAAGPSWEVDGFPGISRLRPGETLQTGTASQAEVKIANIGQLLVSPDTRIRLLVTKSNEHRIALDRGRVEAQTWAQPRLFIVDTPSASAVDLGCKYSLEVQEDGSSLLHVTVGLVAFERDGRETIVPAGAFCRTRRNAGPGTPFFEDSSTDFKAALQKVDSLSEGPERTRQLEIVLEKSHIRDALSLWHLIPRLEAQSRGLIYDRLAQLLPPPPGVTRDGIVALDPKMLDAWRTIVSQLWQ